MDIKQTLLDAYYFRYACKEFDSDKKITAEDFQFILESARLSPSSFGFEPWHFLVLQNMELREKLKPFSRGAQKQLATASHFLIILSRTKDMIYHSEYIQAFMKDIQKLSDDVVKMKSEFYHKFQEFEFNLLKTDRSLSDWAAKQTYIALANMLTATALLKIDSCPMEGFDKKEVERMLLQEKLFDKDHFGVVSMVAFGYRKEEPHHPRTRQTLDAIVDWIA